MLRNHRVFHDASRIVVGDMDPSHMSCPLSVKLAAILMTLQALTQVLPTSDVNTYITCEHAVDTTIRGNVDQ